MKKATYVPVLEIREHFTESERSPYVEDILGERWWKQAGAPPGARSGFVRQPLSKDFQFVDDPILGQIPFRPRLMHHAYMAAWNDRGIGAWEQIPTPEEVDARNAARTYYTNIRSALFEAGEFSEGDQAFLNDPNTDADERKSKIEASKLNKTQGQQLAAALSYIPQFDNGGAGFLKEVYDMFDIGPTVRGILWGFSVPNISKTLISTFELKQEQWQCFRVFLSSPPKDQVDPQFEIILGNGATQYALVIGKDDAVEFRHYKNMKASARGALERQLEQVLDTGRLTPDDMLEIQSYQDEINALEKKRRDAGQKKLIGPEAVRSAVLHQQIKATKESKSGLTDANRALKENLEKQLYYDVFPISFPVDTHALYNSMLDIHISFHRKGYIGIQFSKAEPVYVEIKGITKTLNYGTMLPAHCRIMVRSRGGKFFLAHGNPDFVDHCLMYGQPFSLPYSLGETENVTGPDGNTRKLLTASEYSVELDAVGIGEDLAAPGDNLALLPNCHIEVAVEELKPFVSTTTSTGKTIVQSAIYRLCLDSYSLPDEKSKRREFSPEIYRGTIFIPGESSPLPSTQEWDSITHRYPISDVLVQDAEDRACMHEVYCDDNIRKPAHLPLNLDGRCCDLYVVNQATGDKIYLQQNGVVKSPNAKDVGRIIGADGDENVLALTRRATTGTQIDVHSAATLLDRPVRFPLIGNNRPPGDYIFDLLVAHGIPEWFGRNLPIGDVEGLDRLPKASAGQMADIKPTVGVSLLNYIRGDIVQKHCLGWRFVTHPTDGCLLEPDENRERPDLAFSTRVPHDDALAMLGPLHFRQNTDDYASEILVTGAYDPGRGERFSSYSRRYEATKQKNSTYFTGTDHTFIAPVDESLKSQTKCDLYARSLENKKGLPPIEADQAVWWRPDLHTGDIPTFDGVRFVVKGIRRSSLKIAQRQQCVLSLRLADPIHFNLD
jgi:hypothetical protein